MRKTKTQQRTRASTKRATKKSGGGGSAGKDQADADTRSPIHYAAFGGHLDIVKILVRHGGHTDGRESMDASGRTPLHAACQRGNLNVVEYLVTDRKVRVNPTDSEAHVPLHFAALNGSEECVKFLLLNGANHNATNEYGRTAADVAKDRARYEALNISGVIEAIRDHRKKERKARKESRTESDSESDGDESSVEDDIRRPYQAERDCEAFGFADVEVKRSSVMDFAHLQESGSGGDNGEGADGGDGDEGADNDNDTGNDNDNDNDNDEGADTDAGAAAATDEGAAAEDGGNHPPSPEGVMFGGFSFAQAPAPGPADAAVPAAPGATAMELAGLIPVAAGPNRDRADSSSRIAPAPDDDAPLLSKTV